VEIHFTNKKIEPVALDALRSGTIRRITDQEYALDTFQMEDKKDYGSFKSVIVALKGRWTGETHLFQYDPTEAIAQVVASGFVPDHNPYSLFETPEEGIPELFVSLNIDSVYLDGNGWRFLEPSAGTGRIAKQIKERFPMAEIDVCEIDPANRAALEASGFNVIADDFLALETEQRYDYVLMNPPFDKTTYIDHVRKAFGLLKVYGKLGGIIPSGFLNPDRGKVYEFRNFVAEYGGWERFEYRFENTSVECFTIWLDNYRKSDIARLWSKRDGYDSFYHKRAEIILEHNCESFSKAKSSISKHQPETWRSEIARVCDSIVVGLIKSGDYCILWDDRVRSSVVQSVIKELLEYLEEEERAVVEKLLMDQGSLQLSLL
jgi:Methyltransferase small domain